MVSHYVLICISLMSNDVHVLISSREVSVHIFCLLVVVVVVSLLILRFLYTSCHQPFCHLYDLLIFILSICNCPFSQLFF